MDISNKASNLVKEEDLLLDSEILKNISEGIFLLGINDFVIKYTNPGFEKMFGFDPGELIGKEVSTINAPAPGKTPQEIRDEIAAVIEEKGRWYGEIENIKKDGTHFWCTASVSPFNHPEYGDVYIAVHTDITELKETKRKEALLVAIVNNSDDAIYSKDLDGTITSWNKGAEQIYGYTAEEIMGKNVVALAPAEKANEIKDILAKIARGENYSCFFHCKGYYQTQSRRVRLVNCLIIV